MILKHLLLTKRKIIEINIAIPIKNGVVPNPPTENEIIPTTAQYATNKSNNIFSFKFIFKYK